MDKVELRVVVAEEAPAHLIKPMPPATLCPGRAISWRILRPYSRCADRSRRLDGTKSGRLRRGERPEPGPWLRPPDTSEPRRQARANPAGITGPRSRERRIGPDSCESASAPRLYESRRRSLGVFRRSAAPDIGLLDGQDDRFEHVHLFWQRGP